MPPSHTPNGELLSVPDRIVVSPRNGVFVPLEPQASVNPGSDVAAGQLIGHVRCGTEMMQVTSPFAGVARGLLAWPNERVREFQPVLWMSAATN